MFLNKIKFFCVLLGVFHLSVPLLPRIDSFYKSFICPYMFYSCSWNHGCSVTTWICFSNIRWGRFDGESWVRLNISLGRSFYLSAFAWRSEQLKFLRCSQITPYSRLLIPRYFQIDRNRFLPPIKLLWGFSKVNTGIYFHAKNSNQRHPGLYFTPSTGKTFTISLFLLRFWINYPEVMIECSLWLLQNYRFRIFTQTFVSDNLELI